MSVAWRERSPLPPALREDKKKEGGIPDWLRAYHAVLAVNRPPTGFRGINGFLPAKTRVPSIYSTVPSSCD